MQLECCFEPKNAVSNRKTSIKSLTNDNDVTIKLYQVKHNVRLLNARFIVIT